MLIVYHLPLSCFLLMASWPCHGSSLNRFYGLRNRLVVCLLVFGFFFSCCLDIRRGLSDFLFIGYCNLEVIYIYNLNLTDRSPNFENFIYSMTRHHYKLSSPITTSNRLHCIYQKRNWKQTQKNYPILSPWSNHFFNRTTQWQEKYGMLNRS